MMDRKYGGQVGRYNSLDGPRGWRDIVTVQCKPSGLGWMISVSSLVVCFDFTWVRINVSKIVQCMPSSFFCSSFLSSRPFSFAYLHSFLPLCPLSFFSQLLLFYLWFFLRRFLPLFCPYNTSSCPSSMMNLFASPFNYSFLSLYLDLLSPLFYFFFSPVDFSLLLSLSLFLNDRPSGLSQASLMASSRTAECC